MANTGVTAPRDKTNITVQMIPAWRVVNGALDKKSPNFHPTFNVALWRGVDAVSVTGWLDCF